MTTTDTSPASIIARAIELAEECAAEAIAEGEQRQADHERRTIDAVKDAVEDTLPDLAPHATILYDAVGGTDGVVLIADSDDDALRLEAERGTFAVALHLATPCPACGAYVRRGPQIDDLTDLGIALTSAMPEHRDGTRDGTCNGETFTPAVHTAPAPLWRSEVVTNREHLTTVLNQLEDQGYRVQWPPLMDGHVVVGRRRG